MHIRHAAAAAAAAQQQHQKQQYLARWFAHFQTRGTSLKYHIIQRIVVYMHICAE